jgi:hypothetical protein
MANRIYGEARLKLADNRELTLRFDFAALVEAEEASGLGTQAMLSEFAGKGGAHLKTARAMLYGGLRYHHPDLTLEDVGDLLMTDGEAVSGAMGRAMEEMAERRSPNPRKGAAAEPSKPPLGTSTRSSPRGAKAA